MLTQYGAARTGGHEACHERGIFTKPSPARDAQCCGGASSVRRHGGRPADAEAGRRGARSRRIGTLYHDLRPGCRIPPRFALWRLSPYSKGHVRINVDSGPGKGTGMTIGGAPAITTTDSSWATRGACVNMEPDGFFVQGAEQHAVKVACGGCPVRTECLADA